jgi:hypothetical protein
MTIIFGWGTAALILNQYPTLLACPTCRQPRFFNIALIYSYFTLFYLFGIVYERHHTLRGSICQHEPDMLPLDIEQQARPASIPWRHRYGLALLIVLVSVLSCWLLLASRS